MQAMQEQLHALASTKISSLAKLPNVNVQQNWMINSNSLLSNLAATKQVLFFGGKGGVGKTTVSAATALLAAETKRVLLVSTDPAHNLGHLFNRELAAHATRLAPNLDVIELDPQQTIDRHLKEVGGVLRRLMPVQLVNEVDKHLELSREAPGMEEAALLERIAEVVEEASRDYDLVIFDTAPSGHTARLMALPEMMSAWTDGLLKRREKSDRLNAIVNSLGSDNSHSDKVFGEGADSNSAVTDDNRESMIRTILNRRKQRFNGLRETLNDPEKTAFVIVLAAERLPVLESIELYQRLVKTGVSIGGLVVNKRLPEDSSPFLQQRREQEQQHLSELQAALPKVTRQDLPLVAHDVVGLDALQQFAETLKAQ